MASQHLKRFVVCAGGEWDARNQECSSCKCAANDTFSTEAMLVLQARVKRKCAEAFDILSVQDSQLRVDL
jgi:hypothetical protein